MNRARENERSFGVEHDDVDEPKQNNMSDEKERELVSEDS